MVDRNTALAFAVGAVTGAAAIHTVLNVTRSKPASETSSFGSSSSKQASNAFVDDADEDADGVAELEQEQFSRNIAFLEDSGFNRVRDARIIVVGLGGVGSHTAHMLARSGARHLRIIDFDQVTLSSLNRHAVATLADVGRPKAEVLRDHLLRIVPRCEIDARVAMFEASRAEELLLWRGSGSGSGSDQQTDTGAYVADCIDDVVTKVALIHFCQQRGIKVISCMGAGAKADPTRLHIGDLNDATRDPLAHKVRWHLGKLQREHATDGDATNAANAVQASPERKQAKTKRSGPSSSKVAKAQAEGGRGRVMSDGVACVYSSEKPLMGLLDLEEEQIEDPSQFGNVEHFRLRTIPVLGTMPALMGQAIAAHMLCDLARTRKVEPVTMERMSRKNLCKLFDRFKAREARYRQARKAKGEPEQEEVFVDTTDIETVVHSIWRCRSALSGVRMGERSGRMCVTRWRPDQPPYPNNLVFVTEAEAQEIDTKGADAAFAPDCVGKVERTLHAMGSAW